MMWAVDIEALKALVKAVDGREVHSELTENVYKELGLKNINQIMKVIYYALCFLLY